MLGFKFQVVKKAKVKNTKTGMDMLTKIARGHLTEPDSKVDKDKLKTKVRKWHNSFFKSSFSIQKEM